MTGQWQGSTRRAQLPPDWARRRARILERDGHRCTHLEHGQRCTARATDVHHIGDRDDHSDRNLTSLCAPHHRAETTAEAAAALAAKAAQRHRPAPPHPGLIQPEQPPSKGGG